MKRVKKIRSKKNWNRTNEFTCFAKLALIGESRRPVSPYNRFCLVVFGCFFRKELLHRERVDAVHQEERVRPIFSVLGGAHRSSLKVQTGANTQTFTDRHYLVDRCCKARIRTCIPTCLQPRDWSWLPPLVWNKNSLTPTLSLAEHDKYVLWERVCSPIRVRESLDSPTGLPSSLETIDGINRNSFERFFSSNNRLIITLSNNGLIFILSSNN